LNEIILPVRLTVVGRTLREEGLEALDAALELNRYTGEF